LWFDRGVLVCLFLLAAAAPHSIAVTQIAWIAGMLLWIVRYVVARPRFVMHYAPIDYALLGLFILTFVSALFSYNQGESIGKLRSASLFTIVYLVTANVASRRMVRALALMLIVSCMVNIAYTFAGRAVGRGIRVEGLRTESPLYVAGIRDGDTVLDIDDAPVRDTERLADEIAIRSDGNASRARVRVYRVEAYPVFEVERGLFLDGDTFEARLGIGRWTHGRDWRASGFYSHYVTYAEVLQLIASLALGLLVACQQKSSRQGALLAVAVAGLCGALLLTVTRASFLGLLLSALTIVVVGVRSRRTLLVLVFLALPLIAAALFVLQQKRQVGFIDKRDGSTAWRIMVYREGLDLLVKKPRHLLVGVGMDSIKTRYREWKLFDNGRQHIGHFHSTPLQLAVERGLQALLVWFALLAIYARVLWQLARRPPPDVKWVERGIVLGALGGLVGFFASGTVHYNLGDSEVSMIFYFIMGLVLVLERFARASCTAHNPEVTSSRA